jgi:hypothetical protein
MARINFKEVGKIVGTRDSVAWGKNYFENNGSTLVFAGLLIVCSLAVGCSSEKPKTESMSNQTPISQTTPPVVAAPASVPVPAELAAAKPVHKKVVHRAPATVAYVDKTSGVSFQYPRKYALKTGESVGKLMPSDGMDFVQPGGVAIVAVTVPEGAYPKSDLASAFFDVSVNKALTAEQCVQFGGPQAGDGKTADATAQPAVQPTKLMIGEMELKSTGTLASVGSGKEESKYYHVFENGGCYEFAMKVATTSETDEGGKAVDREEIFKRLERILATVKINPVKSIEVTASVPAAAPATAGTPAQ